MTSSTRPRPGRLRRALLRAVVALPVTAVAGGLAGPGLVSSAGEPDGGPSRAWHVASAPWSAEAGGALVRSNAERAARGAARTGSVTLAAEATRRATTEAALAATEQVKDIARVPPPAPTWQAPLDAGYTLTSGFGPRWGKWHPAQDFATPEGTPVRSPSNGTVLLAGWEGPYGNKVEIQLWDGTVVWFAHNSALGVAPGQPVATGQVVAVSGNTGNSTGPHVHVEVHPGGGDPAPVMEWLAARGIPM